MTKLGQEELASNLRVGIITFAAILLLILGIIFAGGDKGLLFQKQSEVKALLANIGGLKKGSSVTMAGMIVGKVSDIVFAQDPQSNLIEVTMSIRQDVRMKIKSDSVPSVRTQGMLGDRYIDITVGSAEADVLSEEKKLIGEAATDFDKTLQKALDVLTETQKLLNSINQQEGTIGKLFYDERIYENLVKLTNELNEVMVDFKKQPRKYVKFSLF